MTHDIFISHASADKEIADAMTEALEAQGIQCWIAPRDIRPGDTWGGSIVRAIESSKMMVIIFSERSNASRQVLREVERAVQKDVVLLPFRIDEDPPSGDMEYFLSATHWLDALTPNLDEHLSELVKISNSILKKPTSSIPASSDSLNPSVKKAEPSIGIKTEPTKFVHPTSSAVSDEIASTPAPKAENPSDFNAEKVAQPVHANHSTELKLEARRTPPGTKSKHSQIVKPKKKPDESPKQKTAIATSKTKRTGEKQSTSKSMVIMPVLVLLAAAGWFLTQQTDLFFDEKAEPPVAIVQPLEKETPAPVVTSVSTEPTTAREKPKDINTSQANSEPRSIDQNTQIVPDAKTEKEAEVTINEAELIIDKSADDVAKENTLSKKTENDASQNSPDNSAIDQPKELATTPAPVAPKVIPKPEPKIDEIPPLVALANTGDVDAILELSERYLNGRGVNRDQMESVRLLEIAANIGSTLAQKKLANYYARGEIVPRNDEQALIWYTLAAEQGDIDSQYSLGEIYEFGFGAEANLLEAKKWYGLAADQGHMKAGLFLEKFRQKVEAASALVPSSQAPDSIQNSAPQVSSEAAPEP